MHLAKVAAVPLVSRLGVSVKTARIQLSGRAGPSAATRLNQETFFFLLPHWVWISKIAPLGQGGTTDKATQAAEVCDLWVEGEDCDPTVTDSEQNKWVAGSIHRGEKTAQGLHLCVNLACSPHDEFSASSQGSPQTSRPPHQVEKCKFELLFSVTL